MEGSMSRLADTFAGLRASGRTGLVTYVTAGDPDLPRSGAVLRAIDAAGADVIEVGVPFSDPLADGPVIQRAAERALGAGTTLRGTLNLIADLRSTLSAPVVVFSYANPILRMGLDRFAAEAAAAGVDGVLVLDLPIEEAGELRAAVSAHGIDVIFLLSPTSTDARIKTAAEQGRGFLYVISRLGVTGTRDRIAGTAKGLVDRIRTITDLPIAVGFGLSRPEHIDEIGQWADAAVVGSGLVRVIAEAGDAADVGEQAAAYVRWLTKRNGKARS
jgi:tryptophan synthase alpha chain